MNRPQVGFQEPGLPAPSLPQAQSAPQAGAGAAASPPFPAGAREAPWTEQIRSEWRAFVVTVAAVTLLAAAAAFVQPERFEASALVAVTPLVQRLDAESVIRGVDALERRTLVATIAALASSPAARRVALGPTAAASEDYAIDASVLPNTNLIRIDVTGGNRALVTGAANRIPALLSEQATAMYGVYRVTTVSPAAVPEDPISPRVARTIVAGLLAGLLLGLVLAYALAQRRLATGR